MRDLLFVCCTTGEKEATPLYASWRKLAPGECLFFENNRRGLSACYNEVLEREAGGGRVVVFVHDDVVLGDALVAEKLAEGVGLFDVVGVVGSARFFAGAAEAYRWSVWPQRELSGAIENVDGPVTWWASFGATPRRCVILDGLLLAVDTLTLGRVRFDERFAFHLYDLDFTLTAHRAGLACGTMNIWVQHASRGDYEGAAYREAAALFREKWAGVREQV